MAISNVESDSWDEERNPSPNNDENYEIHDAWTNPIQTDLLAQNFAQQHILGNCHPDKHKNTVGAFDRAQYKALAHHNSLRIPGCFPGQIKAVTKEPLYHEPFSEKDHFMVTGPKFGNKFIPEHLEGQLEVLGSVKVFKDNYGQKFNEILSDITAEVESLRQEIETPDELIEEIDNLSLKEKNVNLQEKM